MKCKCSYEFCYKCGRKYRHPDCKCPLFDRDNLPHPWKKLHKIEIHYILLQIDVYSKKLKILILSNLRATKRWEFLDFNFIDDNWFLIKYKFWYFKLASMLSWSWEMKYV